MLLCFTSLPVRLKLAVSDCGDSMKIVVNVLIKPMLVLTYESDAHCWLHYMALGAQRLCSATVHAAVDGRSELLYDFVNEEDEAEK